MQQGAVDDDDRVSKPMKLRHESVVLKDLTKEERLAIRKASMTAGDSWEDLHGTKDRPEKQTFRGHLNDGLSSRHNVDDSQAAEDAAKEAARKRPGHEVLGTLKSHGRKGSERASGDEHVRV